jgi:hypothetical protein
MDALSEALNAVRMTGAIFYHAECTAPWGFRVPCVRDVAHVLAPGTERLVSYHLVTEGKAVVCFPEAAIPVSAGDVLIIPHGDAHTVSNGSPQASSIAATRSAAFWRAISPGCDWAAEAKRPASSVAISDASDTPTGCFSLACR